MNAKKIFYWVSTGLLVFMMLPGGVFALLHTQENLDGMRLLGYPDYFSYIIGVWKILGSLAIVAPGFPRLKEWAYAGIFFDVTGAAASNAFMHQVPFHIVAPVIAAAITLTSWALRPPTRRLGEVVPAT
jgi:hypothetical protein